MENTAVHGYVSLLEDTIQGQDHMTLKFEVRHGIKRFILICIDFVPTSMI